MHPIYRISSLGRPVDPRWPSNRAILILCGVAFVAGTAWGFGASLAWSDALLRGVTATFITFASWALGRELDPDVNATAFVAVAGANAAWVLSGRIDLWTLGAALLLSRLIARTVGPAPKLTDLALLLAALWVAVVWGGHWSLAPAAALALILDTFLPEGRRLHLAAAALALAPIPWLWAQGDLHVAMPSAPLALGVLAAITGLAVLTMPTVRSPCDLPGHDLQTRRIQAALAVALFTVIAANFEPTSGLAGLAVAATLLAVIAGRGFRRARPAGGLVATPE